MFRICLVLFISFSVNSFAVNPLVEWVKPAGGNENETTQITTVDKAGNVFIAGTSNSADVKFENTQLFCNNPSYGTSYLAKYDTKGNLLWVKGGGTGNSYSIIGLVTDKNNNVYISGSFSSPTLVFGRFTLVNDAPYYYGKAYLAKFDSKGNVLWALAPKTYHSSAMYGLCIDSNDNIYGTGHFQDNNITYGSVIITNFAAYQQDIFLVKFDSSGKALWGKNFGGYYNDVGRSIELDNLGNILLTGVYKSTVFNVGQTVLSNTDSNTNNVFLFKLSPTGNVIWAKSAGNEGEDYCKCVVTDHLGNSYICGNFKSTSISFGNIQLQNGNGTSKSFISKYDSQGNVLWVKTSDASGIDEFNAVAVDRQGDVYTCGAFESSTISYNSTNLKNQQGRGNDVVLVKFHGDGNIIWLKNIGDIENATGSYCSVDSNKNVFLGGNFSSKAIYFDKFKIYNATFNTLLSNTSDFFIAKIKQIDDTISIKYCTSDTTITLTAPKGNVLYKWKYKNFTQTTTDSILTIKNPGVGTIITCEITAIDGSSFTTIPKAIEFYSLISDFNFTITNCKTNTVQFTDNSESSHKPLTYKWTFGDGTFSTDKNPTHTFSIGGKNSVILEISNPLSSCSDTISKIVETYSPMNVNIIGNTVICKGDVSILKASGAISYLWSNGSKADSIVVNEYTGKVWLLGYYGNGLCVSDTIYKTITVGNPIIRITGQLTYCKNNSTLIKADGCKSYFWSNGKTAAEVSFSTPGVFWVYGQSESGCYSDTLSFTITQEPDWSLILTGNNSYCKDDSTLISASGGVSYKWNTGQSTAGIYVKTPGMYIVTAYNQRGCFKTDSITITEHNLPFSDFEMSDSKINILNNKIYFTIVSESNVQYNWNIGDNYNRNGNSFEYTFNATNIYNDYFITLTATNNFGCSSTTTKTIQVIPFVPNVFTPNKDGINEMFMPGVELFIYDRYGKTLYNGNSGWDGTYNGKDMPSDTYFYYLTYLDKNLINQSLKGYLTLIR